MNFDKSILREADIRGIYPHQISAEFANRLGKVFGTYVKSVYLTTTMGPGIKVDSKNLQAEVKEIVG